MKRIRAYIITIGDEILIGDTLDTNAHWLSELLTGIGIDVIERLVVGDDEHQIKQALDTALSRAEIVLMTGGLGPTPDDKTRQTLADYFNSRLVMDESLLEKITEMFRSRGLPLPELNKQQALVPDKCTPLINARGTAPGMWFEKNGKVVVSMPGVPDEMRSMMHAHVIPRLKAKYQLPVIVRKYILTAAAPESFLADKLKGFEKQLPGHIKMAYLPSWGIVKIRLTAVGPDRNLLEEELQAWTAKIEEKIGKYIFGYDDDTLEGVVGKLLKEKQQTLCTAESCSGGMIAHMITTVPGSSAYYLGSVVSYSNSVKEKVLGVRRSTLEKHGAVSEQTVREMVKGAIGLIGADYGIAVSGIAGPDGGTPEKPVGTVWFAVGTRDEIITRKYHLPGNRLQNIHLTAIIALEMLRRLLIGSLKPS